MFEICYCIMGSDSDLFELASTSYNRVLGDNISSIFLENNYFEEGENFVLEEGLTVLENLNQLETDRNVKPIVLFRDGGHRYTSKEVDAFVEQLADADLVNQDNYGRIDPDSYIPKYHRSAEDTLKGLRFEERRERDFQALKDEDFEFYLERVDDKTLEDVVIMSKPVMEDVLQYGPKSEPQAVENALHRVKNSPAITYFDRDPRPSRIRDTFAFLEDLGLASIDEGAYLSRDNARYALGRLDTLRSHFTNIEDDLWEEDGRQVDLEEYEDRRPDDLEMYREHERRERQRRNRGRHR